jgi:hypothetical protein
MTDVQPGPVPAHRCDLYPVTDSAHESWLAKPCPSCGHRRDAHEVGQPASVLFCASCPGGICYRIEVTHG